jgi:hypothetical protein
MAHQQPVQLSDAEEVLALARIRVQCLADALMEDPISRVTYTELTAYLEGPGWRACDALDALRSMTTAQVRDRITEVLACTSHATTRRAP